MRSINPATGKLLARFEPHSEGDVERALDAAVDIVPRWRGLSFDERAARFRRVAELLEERCEELATVATQEMGKPIAESRSELEKCAWVCRYYAEHAERFLTRDAIETDATRSYVRYDPLGVVFAIMPWNFPYWQVFRFAAPSLMAGNVGVLKHAPNVFGCADRIEALFADADFPSGVFTSLRVDEETAGEIIDDRRVAAVTLTGSVAAGKAVGGRAGAAIKPVVLELGGSDPCIVLRDADLDAAADGAVLSRMINSGQSCIAAKRMIVERPVYTEFVEHVRERIEGLVVGDPLDGETDVGPLAREDLRDALDEQVRRSVEAGARCVTGGSPIEGDGWFYQPTLLAEVPQDSAAFSEETFGPVAAIMPVDDEREAIDVANSVEYGLGASIWTEAQRGEALAERIESGHVAVNGIVKSDPRLPFGGIKESGVGRELGPHGIHAFVNAKTVWVRDRSG